MSDNKSARKKLEKIFGKICMIEAAGIRYIPKEERRKLKGYSKNHNQITYHHIKEKHSGGKRTVENGALVREYNHVWLHSLPQEQKDAVNNEIIYFKASFLQAQEDKLVETGTVELPLEFDTDGECVIIPVYDTSKKEKFNRAKAKQEFKKKVDEYYKELEDDDLER